MQCDTAAPGSGTPGALAAEVLPGPHLDTDRVEALVNTLKDSAFGESHLMWVRMQERYGKVRATHSSSRVPRQNTHAANPALLSSSSLLNFNSAG